MWSFAEADFGFWVPGGLENHGQQGSGMPSGAVADACWNVKTCGHSLSILLCTDTSNARKAHHVVHRDQGGKTECSSRR